MRCQASEWGNLKTDLPLIKKWLVLATFRQMPVQAQGANEVALDDGAALAQEKINLLLGFDALCNDIKLEDFSHGNNG